MREVRSQLLRLHRHRKIGEHAITVGQLVRLQLDAVVVILELELHEVLDRTSRQRLTRTMLRMCQESSAMLGTLLDARDELDPTLAERVDSLCAPLSRPPILDRLRRWVAR